jgi:LysM repeat protein
MAKIIYKVVAGDFLQKIAAEQLGDANRWPEIAYINSLKQPYLIKINDILLLPNDNDALHVVIKDGTAEQPPMNTVAKNASEFSVTPATVTLFVIATVFFLIWESK